MDLILVAIIVSPLLVYIVSRVVFAAWFRTKREHEILTRRGKS